MKKTSVLRLATDWCACIRENRLVRAGGNGREQPETALYHNDARRGASQRCEPGAVMAEKIRFAAGFAG
jgi:hypothetical protein